MDLQSFFHPSSIAIVGVSTNPKKVGHLVAKNMLDQGYDKELYFIHPEASELLGKKSLQISHRNWKKKIDLVILAVPAHIGIAALKEVNQIGCKNVIMYAAGFKETSEEGAELEKKLITTCKEYGITLLGPNCLGFINTQDKINATFLKGVSPAGNIGFISQSGAIGSVMVDYFAGHTNLGFSYFVSMGNKSVIDEADALAFLKSNSETEVVAMYLEDVKDGVKFRKVLEATCKVKPVIILKSGSTEAGSKAALSHTGGMVGSDEVYEALFRQCGAIRAENYSEFINLLRLFSFKRLPTSRSTLVLSNAGGIGVLLADDLIKHNLSLVTVSESTKKQLYDAFSETKKISIHNPIDLLGDASAFEYEKAIGLTLDEKNIGATIILLTPQANTEILKTAKIVAQAQERFSKPIYPVFMGKKSLERTHNFFEEHKIPYFKTYDGLPLALEAINTYFEWINSKKVAEHVHDKSVQMLAHKPTLQAIFNLSKGKDFLNLEQSLHVLQLMGISTAQLTHIRSKEELDKLSSNIQFPCVIKLASDTITHKTEVGGVVTNVTSINELELAFQKIIFASKGQNDGCYIQPMVKGQELFIGAKRDKVFGAVVVIGLGGIYAELLKEVVNFIYPFSYQDFLHAVEKTKLGKLLQGFRGMSPLDSQGLYEYCLTVAHLLDRYPQIKEIDINPLFASGNTTVAVDARVILENS